MTKLLLLPVTFLAIAFSFTASAAKKPNFLIIWGDDIGISNISAYSQGIMGYKTPNIDSIAKDGVLFTDYYGDQSCTAGRSTFITGQSGIRTGLTKVGLPGSPVGIQSRDLTIAEVMKSQGYVTGQFGKNHFGDKDEYLPTKHGFDEFYGNLYHLNAEEEPEDPDYPKDPKFKKMFGPRGVIHAFADGKIKDTGPLTKKRMETVDEDIVNRSIKFMQDAVQKKKKPFFVWVNTTGMHFRTHPRKESKGLSGQGPYNDVMVQHDQYVGKLLDTVDSLGIEKDTFVMYSTDNGVHFNTWPDAGITPFRSEKNTNWEGAYRVPAVVKYPAMYKGGQILNGIVSHLDWMPTLATLAGAKDLKKKLLKGTKVGKSKSKLHLDGYDMNDYLSGKAKESPRTVYHYISDEGIPVGLRTGDWKCVYAENNAKTMFIWLKKPDELRMPKIFNLRRDPYEKADTGSNSYYDWMIGKAPYIYKCSAETLAFLNSFKKYPPSQKPDSWDVGEMATEMLKFQKN